MTPSRAVYDLCEPEEQHKPYSLTRQKKNDEIAGYWQCAEWLEDLIGIADECDRIISALSTTRRLTWSPDRPTEPGEYWLSIEPGKRMNHPPVMLSRVLNGGDVHVAIYYVPDHLLDGALWARRETPEDPFKER